MLWGIQPTIGITLLIIFLVGVSFQIHNYWKVEDGETRQLEMINFTKNMALAGALLMLLLISQPWPFSVRLG